MSECRRSKKTPEEESEEEDGKFQAAWGLGTNVMGDELIPMVKRFCERVLLFQLSGFKKGLGLSPLKGFASS